MKTEMRPRFRSIHFQEGRSGGVSSDIDVQGGMQLKESYPESVLVFILPPSREVLEERLRGRKTDNPEVIETRLRNAIGELEWARKYDHQVVNDDLETAVDEVLSIIAKEREAKSGRGADSAPPD